MVIPVEIVRRLCYAGAMRSIACLALTASLTGCASLIVHPADSTGAKAAKYTTRAIIALPTLFASEAGIAWAEVEEGRQGCGVTKDCSAQDAAMMLMLGGMATRPAWTPPPAPVYGNHQQTCTSSVVGNQVYTTRQ